MLFNAGTCIKPTTVSDVFFQAVDYLSYRLKNIHFMNLAQRKKKKKKKPTLLQMMFHFYTEAVQQYLIK